MLKFTVEGQKLELIGDPFVVADSFDYLTGEFRFYSGYDWDLTEKHVFFQLGEGTPYEVVLVDNKFVKTDHVNLTTGTWSIYVIGYDINGATLVERITTNKVSLTVDASGVQDGEPFPPSIIPDILVTVDQSTPQTFVGGIPKLAADRAIDSDNEITDKKYVDEKVATVTADDFNHNDLANKQGGSAGEYYHTTQAQNESLHAHSNKAALDAVSGTNTGDQTLPTRESLGLDTDDTVTFANLSGMNTGDQDAAGVANTPAGNIAAVTVQAAINELDAEKEAVANKVTSISEASTDTQYPSAKCTYGAISSHNDDAGAHASLFAAIQADIALRHALHYTFRWDKVNALGVRLNNAQGISTTITNFCHRGTVNAATDNPFDSIYPWKDRNVCNISIDAYRALSSGASLRDCVISWLGDPDFDYAHVNGAWVYTPEFWYKVWDEGGYRYFDISPIAITGYVHAPEVIEGRWFGGVHTLTIDGVSKSCLLPKPGMPGKNVAVSTLHTYAKNWGASIENIYGYSATDVLMIVEFATMNTQAAIGDGVSVLYRQSSDTIQAAATASATVKVLTDAAANCIAGSIFDIGTANGAANIGSFIIASTALDTDPTYTVVTLTTDGSTPASVTATTANFWSIHGLSNTADASIGAASGYIGTNGKCHAYYRGQVAHANLFRYILGAYRQTATGNIWIANSSAEADAYDALNTAVHKDTGLTLPQGADGALISDYIGSLHLCPDVPAAPFCETMGGSNANPVGDYCYVPTLATANTILIAGGNALYGAGCGRFYGYWNYSAAASSWTYGAVPVLKTPV